MAPPREPQRLLLISPPFIMKVQASFSSLEWAEMPMAPPV